MKDVLISKITSRKFWAMVASMVSSYMIYKGADAGTIESITSTIGMIGSAIIYMLVEGNVDSKK